MNDKYGFLLLIDIFFFTAGLTVIIYCLYKKPLHIITSYEACRATIGEKEEPITFKEALRKPGVYRLKNRLKNEVISTSAAMVVTTKGEVLGCNMGAVYKFKEGLDGTGKFWRTNAQAPDKAVPD